MFVTVKDVFLYSHHGTKNIIIAVLDSVVATIIIPCVMFVCQLPRSARIMRSVINSPRTCVTTPPTAKWWKPPAASSAGSAQVS